MPDNDNGSFSDTERQLISFIQSVRPESAPLLKSRAATEKWLWQGKLWTMVCAVVVFDAALLSGWYGFPALLAIAAAGVPVAMILSLERALGRWKGQCAFSQGRPTARWHFERASS